MHFRLVSPDSLDEARWDALVSQSPYPRLYGRRWYLDAMSEHRWMAIVGGDYQCIMPVMVRSYLFFSIVRPPFLCRQMGPYFWANEDHNASCHELNSFLKKKFILVNHLVSDAWGDNSAAAPRQNHILWLGKNYVALAENYNRNTRRNINKAIHQGSVIDEVTDIHRFIRFMSDNDTTGTIAKIKHQITTMVDKSMQLGQGHILTAYREKNRDMAMAFYIEESDRIYFILCASDKEGKDTKAMYQIIDHIVRKYAGSEKYLDFTGSNIPSIARRNEGFGSMAEVHHYLKLYRFMRK